MTDQEWHELIIKYVEIRGERAVARVFDVSIPTVRRYIEGKTAPHPFVREKALQWLIEAFGNDLKVEK